MITRQLSEFWVFRDNVWGSCRQGNEFRYSTENSHYVIRTFIPRENKGLSPYFLLRTERTQAKHQEFGIDRLQTANVVTESQPLPWKRKSPSKTVSPFVTI